MSLMGLSFICSFTYTRQHWSCTETLIEDPSGPLYINTGIAERARRLETRLNIP